jgi:hypothetical protein
MRIAIAGWLGVAGVVAGFAACSNGNDVAGTVGDDGGGAADDGGNLGDVINANGMGCTGDLQKVVDKDGNVVQNCAPDLGCYGGQCIDACQAAALSHGSIGCDFLIPTPIVHLDGTGVQPCFAAMVANNWPKEVHVTLHRDGQPLDVSAAGRVVGAGSDATTWAAFGAGGIPQDQVGVVFLSSDPTAATHLSIPQPSGPAIPFDWPLTCPVTPAVNDYTIAIGPNVNLYTQAMDTTRGKAFHLHTDYPVSLYDIAPYGGAMSFTPSAELLLPTTAYGTNYVVMTVPYGNASGNQYVQIVATQDQTTVKITPTRGIQPGTDGTPGVPVNTTGTYVLNAGEYLQLANSFDPNQNSIPPEPSGYWANMEISGSPIQSDKPVAVFTGDTDIFSWSSTSDKYQGRPYGGAADGAHQQLAPVSALGSIYVAAPPATRRSDGNEEALNYRIVGTADETTLTYDPPVPNAPTTLSLGQRVDFEATGAFTIASQDVQHPFAIAQVLAGGFVLSGSRPGVTPNLPIVSYFHDSSNIDMYTNHGLGDPDFVMMFPPPQWLTHYTFFTDPTYGLTTLTFMRSKSNGAFKDVNLDCLGVITGWQPVDAADSYEYSRVDIWNSAQSVGGCTNGRHYASSEGPFGLVVWGMDAFSSYGYPAGGNVGSLNKVVVPVR